MSNLLKSGVIPNSKSVAMALRKAAFWSFERFPQVATAIFFRENDSSVVQMRG